MVLQEVVGPPEVGTPRPPTLKTYLCPRTCTLLSKTESNKQELEKRLVLLEPLPPHPLLQRLPETVVLKLCSQGTPLTGTSSRREVHTFVVNIGGTCWCPGASPHSLIRDKPS